MSQNEPVCPESDFQDLDDNLVPTKRRQVRGSIFPREVAELMHRYVRMYASPLQPTKQGLYDRLRAENGAHPGISVPSRATFFRHIDALPRFETYCARHGEKAAVKFRNHQALLSGDSAKPMDHSIPAKEVRIKAAIENFFQSIELDRVRKAAEHPHGCLSGAARDVDDGTE